jgi:hypothetical protein
MRRGKKEMNKVRTSFQKFTKTLLWDASGKARVLLAFLEGPGLLSPLGAHGLWPLP